MFWLVGSLTNNLNEMSFLAGLLNSVGSLGSTFGFLVSAMHVHYNAACAINLALFWISIPPLAWVVFTKVTDSAHGLKLAVDDGVYRTAEEMSNETVAVKSEK
jgi:hypothetical protein